eukprot:scaffold7075_cov274-Pinguiococcus_pyrenoidosus.AAC.12
MGIHALALHVLLEALRLYAQARQVLRATQIDRQRINVPQIRALQRWLLVRGEDCHFQLGEVVAGQGKGLLPGEARRREVRHDAASASQKRTEVHVHMSTKRSGLVAQQEEGVGHLVQPGPLLRLPVERLEALLPAEMPRRRLLDPLISRITGCLLGIQTVPPRAVHGTGLGDARSAFPWQMQAEAQPLWVLAGVDCLTSLSKADANHGSQGETRRHAGEAPKGAGDARLGELSRPTVFSGYVHCSRAGEGDSNFRRSQSFSVPAVAQQFPAVFELGIQDINRMWIVLALFEGENAELTHIPRGDGSFSGASRATAPQRHSDTPHLGGGHMSRLERHAVLPGSSPSHARRPSPDPPPAFSRVSPQYPGRRCAGTRAAAEESRRDAPQRNVAPDRLARPLRLLDGRPPE